MQAKREILMPKDIQTQTARHSKRQITLEKQTWGEKERQQLHLCDL